jgi:hypothetical protein
MRKESSKPYKIAAVEAASANGRPNAGLRFSKNPIAFWPIYQSPSYNCNSFLI